MDALEEKYNRVQQDYDNAAKRFGEDPTKLPSGDFFALVSVRLSLPSFLPLLHTIGIAAVCLLHVAFPPAIYPPPETRRVVLRMHMYIGRALRTCVMARHATGDVGAL